MVIISPMFHNQSNISGITFLTLDQCFVAGSSHGSVDHPVRTGGTKPIFSIYRRSFHRLRQACDFWPVAVAVSCCRDDCRWGTEVTKGFLGPWKLKKTYPESPKSSWMVKKVHTDILWYFFYVFFDDGLDQKRRPGTQYPKTQLFTIISGHPREATFDFVGNLRGKNNRVRCVGLHYFRW